MSNKARIAFEELKRAKQEMLSSKRISIVAPERYKCKIGFISHKHNTKDILNKYGGYTEELDKLIKQKEPDLIDNVLYFQQLIYDYLLSELIYIDNNLSKYPQNLIKKLIQLDDNLFKKLNIQVELLTSRDKIEKRNAIEWWVKYLKDIKNVHEIVEQPLLKLYDKDKLVVKSTVDFLNMEACSEDFNHTWLPNPNITYKLMQLAIEEEENKFREKIIHALYMICERIFTDVRTYPLFRKMLEDQSYYCRYWAAISLNLFAKCDIHNDWHLLIPLLKDKHKITRAETCKVLRIAVQNGYLFGKETENIREKLKTSPIEKVVTYSFCFKNFNPQDAIEWRKFVTPLITLLKDIK